MSPFLWCLFVLQWNMIARVSNAAGVKLSLVSWDNDRLKIKHPKTKTDGEGKKAFPMSLMANRYCWCVGTLGADDPLTTLPLDLLHVGYLSS